MKRTASILFALLFLAASWVQAQNNDLTILNAQQVAKLDLSGKWTGQRQQYSWDQKSFIESFEYEFDLTQKGNTVTGTSTIITANGEYADMKLEGVIIGNKLHFREYEVKSAIRPEGMVWCFKSGELYFSKEGNNLKLIGATPSFMEGYNYPCSGGVTTLVKVDNSFNVAELNTEFNADKLPLTEDMAINVYPNPFMEYSTISYTIDKDAKVSVEVFDLSGKLITTLFNGKQKAGSYKVTFNAKESTNESGIYIAKLTVNGEVHSKQMVQFH